MISAFWRFRRIVERLGSSRLSQMVCCAYIPYLEVLPEWRGKGIGSESMRRMMAKLETIYAIDLICDENVQEFYERLGFRESRAMTIRNYSQGL